MLLNKSKLLKWQSFLNFTVDEFEKVLSDIEDEGLSAKKESAKILAFLKQQIRIRKKVLRQKVKITVTTHGRKRPLSVLIQEVCELISETQLNSLNLPLEYSNPQSLVGQHILQKFVVDDNCEEWYHGFVHGYDGNTHSVTYNDTPKTFNFNLMEDLLSGDLKVLSI